MKKSFAVLLTACFIAVGTQLIGQQSNQPQQATKQDKTKKEVVVKDKNKGMGSRDTINNKTSNDNHKKSMTVKKKTTKKNGDTKQLKKTTKENR